MTLRKWLKSQITWAERRIDHAQDDDELVFWECVHEFLTEQRDWLKGEK